MPVRLRPHAPDLTQRPASLPRPRGPLTAALLSALRGPVRTLGADDLPVVDPVDPLVDDDLQLALFLAHELAYRGLAGVDERWELALVEARTRWEDQVRDALVARLGPVDTPAPDDVPAALAALAAADSGPSLAPYLMRSADREQFVEFVTHRSLYHLKEADPHTLGIPRLPPTVKAAMVAIQADEYGNGSLDAMHSVLFARLMASLDLDTSYGAHLDRVGGPTLLTTNVISLFGSSRRWRGALAGHLAMFEMTSSVPNGRIARGFRRIGGDEEAARFFDEHVVADALHEQIAAHDLAGALARLEPELCGDIVLGARSALLADAIFAHHLLTAWAAGRSSLVAA